jgi:hypothetical protein
MRPIGGRESFITARAVFLAKYTTEQLREMLRGPHGRDEIQRAAIKRIFRLRGEKIKGD